MSNMHTRIQSMAPCIIQTSDGIALFSLGMGLPCLSRPAHFHCVSIHLLGLFIHSADELVDRPVGRWRMADFHLRGLSLSCPTRSRNHVNPPAPHAASLLHSVAFHQNYREKIIIIYNSLETPTIEFPSAEPRTLSKRQTSSSRNPISSVCGAIYMIIMSFLSLTV